MNKKSPLVSILMGSDSDWPVMQAAGKTLDEFGVSWEARVISAHRAPDQLAEYVRSSEANGIRVFIAGAGGAAHLPGVTAALTTRPVIGIPCESKFTASLDSLLSIVQMPPGVPVATVAIGGGRNAGILAVQILAQADDGLAAKLKDFKKRLVEENLVKNKNIQKSG
ncbi:MAG TPA: 5-(carboxyamino)imidazole ribonucleotide mutase [Verrucomicrobiae bacterium]